MLRFSLLIFTLLCVRISEGKGGGGKKKEIVPAVIISQNPSSVEIQGTVELTCSFPTLSNVQALFWFKSYDILLSYTRNTSYKYTTNTRITPHPWEEITSARQHTVEITDIEPEDAGKYRCDVETPQGHEEGEIDLVVNPHEIQVEKYGSVNLTCHGENTGDLVWVKDKKLFVHDGIVQGQDTFEGSGYGVTSNSLSILNMTSSYEGVYTCYSSGMRRDIWRVFIPVPVKKIKKVPAWIGEVIAVVLGVILLGTLGVTCYIQQFKLFSDEVANFEFTPRNWVREGLEIEGLRSPVK